MLIYGYWTFSTTKRGVQLLELFLCDPRVLFDFRMHENDSKYDSKSHPCAEDELSVLINQKDGCDLRDGFIKYDWE